ncbi:hypothetical protein [Granulicatella adiacens]|uniref:hypothetical protein n=1 Tax=Granulicatella adiacens TaxID=46124 RepID=UPI00241F5D43|nr:hypothetical protein [Granulicatella adiacens]
MKRILLGLNMFFISIFLISCRNNEKSYDEWITSNGQTKEERTTSNSKSRTKKDFIEIDISGVKISVPNYNYMKLYDNYAVFKDENNVILEILVINPSQSSKRGSKDSKIPIWKDDAIDYSSNEYDKIMILEPETKKELKIKDYTTLIYQNHHANRTDVKGSIAYIHKGWYLVFVRTMIFNKGDYSVTLNTVLESITIPEESGNSGETAQPTTTTTTTTMEDNSLFTPSDTSNETISKIETYKDYLEMYGKIVEEYLLNFENKLKSLGLYTEEYFSQISSESIARYKDTIKQYESFRQTNLGKLKPSFVKFLISLRDNLKKYVDNL